MVKGGERLEAKGERQQRPELFFKIKTDGNLVDAFGSGRKVPLVAHGAEGGFVEERPGAGSGGFGGEHAAVRINRETDEDGAFHALANCSGGIDRSGLAAFAATEDERLGRGAG